MGEGFKEEFARLRREHARLYDPVGLRGGVELVPEPEGRPAPPASGTDALGFEPSAIDCRLDAFHDQSFEVAAPGARKAELLWRRDGGVRRASMSHARHDRFSATVGMEDGEYLFAYEVDGHVAPDARYGQRVLLGPEGVFAPLRLGRHAKELTLLNGGEGDCELRVESSCAWLEVETELTLAEGEEARVPLRLRTERMETGENLGQVRVSVRRVGGDGAPHGLFVPVKAELVVGGSVPVITFSPADFGTLVQGKEEAQLRVEVEARGRGTLRGMITIAHTSQVADFVLDAEGERRHFSHVFNIDSAHLPCRERGAVALTLITDCYLADRRLYRAEVPYRLTYLKKSLPVMNFGAVRQGGAKTMRLDVARSDGEAAELEVTVPVSAAGHLECHLARPGVCVFRFRAPALPPGTALEGDVLLTDRRSGVQDRIRFMAEVAAGGQELHASTSRS